MGARPPDPVTMQKNENGVVSVDTADNFPTLRSNGAGGDQASKSVEKSLISDWEKGSTTSALKSRRSSEKREASKSKDKNPSVGTTILDLDLCLSNFGTILVGSDGADGSDKLKED